MTHDEANNMYDPAMAQPSSEALREEQLIKQAVVRLNGNVIGFVIGTIAALAVFVATNWLVLKGGEVVGPHMRLLDQFFWGYTVTFVGSFIGAAYSFVTGYVCGLLVSWIYNAVVSLRSRMRS